MATPDATDVVMAMGSVSGTIQEACDYLNAKAEREGSARRFGFVQVHLFRPFSPKLLLAALPESVERIAVLDRCKSMGASGEPLYKDVAEAIATSERAGRVKVLGGRYGLSSKDVDPAQIVAAFDNLVADEPINGFTVGIEDDVTHLSLPIPTLDGWDDGDVYSCKFWGLGGDGTVGANKNTIKILADAEDMFAQAYFEFDTKKSYGITKSHLRLSKNPIRGTYFVKRADFVACHNQGYMRKYDVVQEVKPGGMFLLNTQWTADELDEKLPGQVKRYIAQNGIRMFTIDAVEIALRLGLGNHTNTVLQAAFFKVAGLMDADAALEAMKNAARKTYAKKGDAVVAKNVAAIDEGGAGVHEFAVPAAWADAVDTPAPDFSDLPDGIRDFLMPAAMLKGDELPVSTFLNYQDGTFPNSFTKHEKRGIAVQTPVWDSEKCIQCNRCSYVCPHAVVRPYLLNDEEAAGVPAGFQLVDAKGKQAKGLKYSLQISEFDCTGCASCSSVCPSDALTMHPVELTDERAAQWNYAQELSDKGDLFDPYSVKGSQFRQPLLEFSAACAGCGETPYAKLLTQLFGDRVYWANATGCSQAWGSGEPGIPYTVNKRGFGPAWTNSLFENNAELSYGMYLSSTQQREAEKMRVEALRAALPAHSGLAARCHEFLDAFDDFDASRQTADALIAAIEAEADLSGEATGIAADVLKHKDQLAKKTFWMFGGDGWAYDIGFGGLDHVVSTNGNFNVLVVDTEVYSNTGGQSSKATPAGAVAEFASSGKKTGKKDLGAILMSYGNVYVAQVAMGADYNQLVKALKEAEEFDGPAVVIAYAPCTSHGLKCGMKDVQGEMKRATEAGYWPLYRFNPRDEQPMKLDSKEPTRDYLEYLDGENRFASLKKSFPEEAARLFVASKEDAERRYARYQQMAEEVGKRFQTLRSGKPASMQRAGRVMASWLVVLAGKVDKRRHLTTYVGTRESRGHGGWWESCGKLIGNASRRRKGRTMIDTKAFRSLSYGLYIITAKDGDKAAGCVVNTFNQVTSKPAPCFPPTRP